ncbi:MAG: DUF3489 domain-containing protein [Alphaproteobacteria bacterium]
MPNLTDTQRVILAHAAKRDDGAVLPLPASLTLNKGSAASVLKSLIKKDLIEERPASAGEGVWRDGKDGEHVALAITFAGLEAIGVEPDDTAEAANPTTQSKPKNPRKKTTKLSATTGMRVGTKQALLIDLLKRKGGATIDEAVDATGWQRHSVRGAISGTLKKKLGLDVTSEKVESRGRVYRITGRG